MGDIMLYIVLYFLYNVTITILSFAFCVATEYVFESTISDLVTKFPT